MNLATITGVLLSMMVSQGSVDGKIVSKMSNFSETVLLQTIEGEFTKITVDVTAYSPTKRECDSTPFITASNKRVKEGYIAVSRDLEAYVGFGDKVFIKGLGIFEVQDRMNRRWKKRIDLFFFDTKQARRFGKKKREMWILESKKMDKRLTSN